MFADTPKNIRDFRNFKLKINTNILMILSKLICKITD
jgi:hypothetical protein